MARWVHFDVVRRTSGPFPGGEALRALTQALTDHCKAHGVTPVDLVSAESWKVGPGRVHFRLTVDLGPGTGERSPAAWLAWQHAHWDWSQLPRPIIGDAA
jgi:hypothetical protein